VWAICGGTAVVAGIALLTMPKVAFRHNVDVATTLGV